MESNMHRPTEEDIIDRMLAVERAAAIPFAGPPRRPHAGYGKVSDEEIARWQAECEAYEAECAEARAALAADEEARWDAAWAAGLPRPPE